MEEQAAAGEEEEEEATASARKRKRGGGGGGAEAVVEEEEEVGDPDCVYDKEGLLLADGAEDCYEGIAEEAVEDLMRWLEADISDAAPDPGAGFVTINGNEETCGPSFSCAASTVMASVDTRAGAPPPPPVPWPLPEPAADKQEELVVPDDEAWLAELLACGPALQGV